MDTSAQLVKSVSFNLFPNPRTSCKKSLVILFFIWLIGNLLSSPSTLLAQSVPTSGGSAAENYMNKGLSTFQRGAFEQAVLDWKEAAKLFEKERKSRSKLRSS